MPKTKDPQDPPVTDDLFGPMDVGDGKLLRTTYAMVNRITGKKCLDRPNPAELDAANAPQQIDLFVAHLLDANIKDDRSSMGAPIFSLSTKPDMSVWRWTSVDKKRSVEVIPSIKGRATMHDKDLLIYVTSVLVAAMEKALKAGEPMPGRHVEIKLADYLKTTKKNTSGYNYATFEDTLDRLKGTTLKTNIARNPLENNKKAFGLIETFDFDTIKQPDGNRVINESKGVRIVISEWLYRALQEREVLTLSSDYWDLRKPLEKRLYELARAHVGQQQHWVPNEDTLHRAVGTRATLRRFRSMMVDIINDDRLPQYRIIDTVNATGEKAYRLYLRQTFTMLKLVRRKK